jgi:hypothetical protein
MNSTVSYAKFMYIRDSESVCSSYCCTGQYIHCVYCDTTHSSSTANTSYALAWLSGIDTVMLLIVHTVMLWITNTVMLLFTIRLQYDYFSDYVNSYRQCYVEHT